MGVTRVRLDSLAPALVELLRQAPPATRRTAVRRACEIAARSIELLDDVVERALATLRTDGADGVEALREKLEMLAARMDDEYVRSSEQAITREGLRAFACARAVSALVYAVTDDADAPYEAIYEAIMSLEDPAALVQAVTEVLDRRPS